MLRFLSRHLHALGNALERRASDLGSGYVAAAPVLSGTVVTPQTALGLTPVYAAISVISKDVAALPVGLYRKRPDGGFDFDGSHDYQEILGVEVNGDTDALKFSLDGMAHTLGWGNGYSEIVRNSRGQVESLTLLHPSKTQPRRTKGGKLYYLLDNKKELAPENVLHFAGLGFNGILGYTPIYVCRQSLGLALAAEQFGASLFGNGAVPKGFLKTPKKLSEAGINNLRRTFNLVHQGAQNANNLGILEEGMEFQGTQINPDDAQFILTRQFQILEVARLYNLPPHKIGDYSQSHMSNIEESNLDYLGTTLIFWIVMREHAMNRRLLSRDERKKFAIRYDLSRLQLGNMAARDLYNRGMRNMGCFSADDILLREGLNPIGPELGGDKYVVQGQYVPLDQIGRPQESTPKSRLDAVLNGSPG